MDSVKRTSPEHKSVLTGENPETGIPWSAESTLVDSFRLQLDSLAGSECEHITSARRNEGLQVVIKCKIFFMPDLNGINGRKEITWGHRGLSRVWDRGLTGLGPGTPPFSKGTCGSYQSYISFE